MDGQNQNKDYVVIYDLCDKAEKVLKKMQKNDIPKNCIITEDQAKQKFDYNKLKAKVDGEEPEYYYIDLYNKKLFAKVPSNKCSYNTCFESFTVDTDKLMEGSEKNFSYSLKTGKDLVKNSKNIDGILLWVGGNRKQLFFNKEDRRFSYICALIDDGLEYQMSLEKFLSDDNPSFNLFRSSYWENLFHSDENELVLKKTGSFAKLFGVADDGNNRCGVGCFSCGKVMVNNDNYDFYDKYNDYSKTQYATKLSLDDVLKEIGINSETK
ncbi:MAG: hypothetical protein IJT15_04530 [Rickettsiales bacterium]|nr:hypothetical protein [Rickettsiales bacterium]